MAALAASVFFASACGQSASALRSPASPPALVTVDSVVLAETDSSFVGQAWDIAETPEGGFVISDGFTRRLLVFGSDGQFIRSIGRQGDGPGEFRAPTWLALSGDSLVYAADGTDVQMYEVKSGRFLKAYSVPRLTMMLAVHDGTLFIGNVNEDSHASIAVVDRRSPATSMIGPFPAPLSSPPVQQIFDGVVPAVSDRIASAYGVTDNVYIMRLDGSLIDSIYVPAVRRRGVQSALLKRFAEDPSNVELATRAVYSSSTPMDLRWLSSGKLALVSVDGNVENSRITGTSYLSVIDPKTHRACVDALIPGPSDPVPVVSFHGDTVLVLTQRVSAGDRGVTTVHKYRIDTNACDWLPGEEAE